MHDAVSQRPSRLRQWFRQFGLDARYLLCTLPIALAGFVCVIVLFFFGVGTALLWIGLPVLLVTVLVARGFASVQRRMAEGVSGRPAPAVVYRGVPSPSGIRRMLSPLRDPQSWLDVLWVIVNFILTVPVWVLTILWLAAPPAFLAESVILPMLARSGNGLAAEGVAELLGHSSASTTGMLIYLGFGLFFLLSCMPVLRGLASLHLALGEALLCARVRDQARLEQLLASRAAGRRAEADALHRLERDIHDGPQQRLVRLRIDLARAKRQFEHDPVAVAGILDAAMAQAQETLDELRQLSRGIAPPILVDRGLLAAVQEISARSPVPVRVEAGELGELPAHTQSTAYFVIAECLANLNKHARANSAEVSLRRETEQLLVMIGDDGIGGAEPAKGHGLAGLGERLASVDGRLDVTSPQGGPTRIQAVISCAS